MHQNRQQVDMASAKWIGIQVLVDTAEAASKHHVRVHIILRRLISFAFTLAFIGTFRLIQVGIRQGPKVETALIRCCRSVFVLTTKEPCQDRGALLIYVCNCGNQYLHKWNSDINTGMQRQRRCVHRRWISTRGKSSQSVKATEEHSNSRTRLTQHDSCNKK